MGDAPRYTPHKTFNPLQNAWVCTSQQIHKEESNAIEQKYESLWT